MDEFLSSFWFAKDFFDCDLDLSLLIIYLACSMLKF